MATIMIPTPLRQFVSGKDTVEIGADNIGDLLDKLTAEYPDVKKNIMTDEGRLRSFVNVYVNDEDVRYLDREKTPVKDGDTVTIVPSIAGGR